MQTVTGTARRALTWLQQRYADLLDESELRFIEQFLHIDTQSQALLVRMIMRKGRHFGQLWI